MDDRYLELLFKEADFLISDLEKEELYVWIEASEENKKAADKVRKAYDLSGEAASDIVVNLDEEYDQVTKKLLKHRKRRILARVWQIAASILVLVGLFWFGIRKSSEPNNNSQIVQGPLDKYLLEDGSAIWLAENSTLTIEMTPANRKANLSGRGYFEIFEDKNRPFEIQTSLGRINVLGTAFEVEMKEDQSMVVRVSQGQVLLSTEMDSITLISGESGLIADGQLQKSTFSQPAGAWRLKPIVYDQELFSNILEQLKKDYFINFDVRDQALLDCRLSFTMGYQNVSELITILETLIDVRILKTDQSTYSISGKGCK